MTTIVMNTETLAVTEYDWAFQSITGQHAGSALGLYELGGDDDAGTAIDASVLSGPVGGQQTIGVAGIYFTVDSDGQGVAVVVTSSDTWLYPIGMRAKGVSRAMAGAGIQENWLSFGYRNVAGADFLLQRIDAETFVAPTRRL